MRKAHGAVKDENGKILQKAYSAPGKKYMGTKVKESCISISNVVKNCLDPEWSEVEIDLDVRDEDTLAPVLDESWIGTSGPWCDSRSGLRYRFHSYLRA